MLVNKYASCNVQQTADDWMTLCTPCADRYAGQVRKTAEGDRSSVCEFCEAANDPARKAELDADYARFVAAYRITTE